MPLQPRLHPRVLVGPVVATTRWRSSATGVVAAIRTICARSTTRAGSGRLRAHRSRLTTLSGNGTIGDACLRVRARNHPLDDMESYIQPTKW